MAALCSQHRKCPHSLSPPRPGILGASNHRPTDPLPQGLAHRDPLGAQLTSRNAEGRGQTCHTFRSVPLEYRSVPLEGAWERGGFRKNLLCGDKGSHSQEPVGRATHPTHVGAGPRAPRREGGQIGGWERGGGLDEETPVGSKGLPGTWGGSLVDGDRTCSWASRPWSSAFSLLPLPGTWKVRKQITGRKSKRKVDGGPGKNGDIPVILTDQRCVVWQLLSPRRRSWVPGP